MSFTIGSLFDGSGGFPLAATMCGGTPKWSSEIEPYPIAVTKSRFPDVKHLGSVTDIKGGEVEPVDVITFGSPCQDLSVAGKRAGLKHTDNGDDETTRSGLFMEAVRIIKEMREATNGVYPRFALWENVPGAFSSNNGEDFRIVLEELIKIAEPSAVMPEVPKNGWPYADSYCGDGWSIAYRVLDAQFWGVPQRRRRIYLVADFRGECAGKVSFEREGLRGYFETGRTPWQTVTGDAENCSGAADCERDCIIYTRGYGGNVTLDGVSPTLEARAGTGGNNQPIVCYSINHQGGNVEQIIEDKAGTLTAAMNSSGNNKLSVAYPYTLKIRSGCEGGGKGALIQTDMSATLATNNDQYLFQPVILDDQGGSQISVRKDGKCPTLRAEMHGNVPCVLGSAGFCTEHSANARGVGFQEEVAPTLRAGVVPACVYSIENHPADSRVDIDESGKVQTLTSRMGTGGGNVPMVMEGLPVVYDGANVTSPINASNPQPGDPCHTLSTDSRNILVEPVYCLQGNGIDRADTAGCNGAGWREDVGYTLNTIDRPAVAYATDVGFFNSQENVSPTLLARSYKDPHLVSYLQDVQYIVRRLTPTECARLQGFPDTWGHPIKKTEFTDEEYQFWLNVRNTHAVINGKTTKDYTEEQILKWYNGLHTDSSEYKMWGNGIALPNALYVMQGIADVMTEEKAARRKWLDNLLGDCL